MLHTYTHDELIDKLKQQMRFLRTSCETFDKGDTEEAIRISATIRILVHDTKNSRSLLHQINQKNMSFYDTSSRYSPTNLLTYQGLCFMRLGPHGADVVARLDAPPPDRNVEKIAFDRWWEGIVITDSNRNAFCRKDLVLLTADKDGGAHIDPQIDENYFDLANATTFGWKFDISKRKCAFNNPILQSIRQIAYEIEKTVQDEFPSLIK